MKKEYVITVGLMASMLLSGCGNAIPEMNETQQAMVTEYAVGTLLKYSGSYNDKIITNYVVEETKVEASGTEDEHPLESVEENVPGLEGDVTDVPTVSVNEKTDVPLVGENVQEVAVPVSSFLGLDGFSVEYQGNQVCEAYSGEEEDVIAFELRAGTGRELLVLKYLVTNTSAQEQSFSVLSKDVKAKISVAGSKRGSLLTMLENDLLQSETMMGANEERVFVIITEIDEGTEVGNISLTLTCEGKKETYTY